jgi:hypothetical protein
MNPLTSTEIVNLVEYFEVPSSRADTARDTAVEVGSNEEDLRNGPPHLEDSSPLVAKYIGTDYHFAYCDEFRSRVASQCVNEPVEFVARIPPRRMRPNRIVPIDSNPNVAIPIEFPNRAGHSVPFSHALGFGSISSLYVLFALLLIVNAVAHLTNSTKERTLDWYWAALPFFSLACDRVMHHVFRSIEPRPFIVTKTVVWFFYVLFPVLAFTRTSRDYAISRDVLDVCCPSMALCYSGAVFLKLRRRIRLL